MGVLLLCPAHAAYAAVWTVTNPADEGTQGTLWYAVTYVAAGDTITFAPNVTQIELTDTLTLKKNLNILGPCVLTLKASWTGPKIFDVWAPAVVTLSDLTVSGGSNGAIVNRNGSTLTLTRCTLQQNTSEYSGGAIVNQVGATLNMTDCTLNGNSCTKYGGGAVGNAGVLSMTGCTLAGNTSKSMGGALYTGGTGHVTLTGCTLTYNTAASGGGLYAEGYCSLSGCTVRGNTPDEIAGGYISDGTNTIGTAPNRQATAFSGYSGEKEPEPRSIVGDADVADVKTALANPQSGLYAVIEQALASDLGKKTPENSAPFAPLARSLASSLANSLAGTLAGMSASLHYANTFEDVALSSQDLSVEYTASWPENVRYYALFSRADGSGYELADRGVQFEIKAGQSLPDGVTPPDFYVPGEGLMTWRSVVTDNGSYDLNPTAGVVTFRVCSVRAAEAVGDKGSGGGCDATAGTGFAPLALLLVAPLIAGKLMRVGGRRNG